MNSLETIKSGVIDRGFPELSTLKIAIQWQQISGLLETSLEKNDFSIDVHQSLKKAPTVVLEGGLAHELSHIVIEISLGTFISFLDRLLYESFPPYRNWDERQTDFLAIDRGFGQELFQFILYSDKHRDEFTPAGLTAKEIQKLVR